MKSAVSIIEALHAAGATLVVGEDGKARVRGVRVPDALLAEVRANREAVIAEWKERQQRGTDRYAEVPEGNVPMAGMDHELTPAQWVMVMNHVLRQPRPVHAWVMARVQEYYDRGLNVVFCESAACIDVLAWQQNKPAREAVAWLQTMDETYKEMNEPTPPPAENTN